MVDQETMVLSWEVLMYDGRWVLGCSFVLNGLLAMVEAWRE
jgi:hypothetical protein